MTHRGRPQTIKLINQRLIREVFLRQEALTCAQVAEETGLSVTTTRAVITLMLTQGELTSLGVGESTGGRRSERFLINLDHAHGVVLGLTDAIHGAVVNSRAEILSTHLEPLDPNLDPATALARALSGLVDAHTRAVGIGVPGVPTASGYLRKDGPNLTDLVDLTPLRDIAPRLLIENDMQASALGFSLQHDAESMVVFLHFESSCQEISAGFVESGRTLRGMGNYAGELGLMPYDAKRDFRQALYDASSLERPDIIAQLVTWICCTVNPRRIMLCTDGGLTIDPGIVAAKMARRLPAAMLPELSTATDFVPYFVRGLAALTAARLFDDPNPPGRSR